MKTSEEITRLMKNLEDHLADVENVHYDDLNESKFRDETDLMKRVRNLILETTEIRTRPYKTKEYCSSYVNMIVLMKMNEITKELSSLVDNIREEIIAVLSAVLQQIDDESRTE